MKLKTLTKGEKVNKETTTTTTTKLKQLFRFFFFLFSLSSSHHQLQCYLSFIQINQSLVQINKKIISLYDVVVGQIFAGKTKRNHQQTNYWRLNQKSKAALKTPKCKIYIFKKTYFFLSLSFFVSPSMYLHSCNFCQFD